MNNTETATETRLVKGKFVVKSPYGASVEIEYDPSIGQVSIVPKTDQGESVALVSIWFDSDGARINSSGLGKASKWTKRVYKGTWGR